MSTGKQSQVLLQNSSDYLTVNKALHLKTPENSCYQLLYIQPKNKKGVTYEMIQNTHLHIASLFPSIYSTSVPPEITRSKILRIHKDIVNMTGNVGINETFRRIHTTIVAMEKQ